MRWLRVSPRGLLVAAAGFVLALGLFAAFCGQVPGRSVLERRLADVGSSSSGSGSSASGDVTLGGSLTFMAAGVTTDEVEAGVRQAVAAALGVDASALSVHIVRYRYRLRRLAGYWAPTYTASLPRPAAAAARGAAEKLSRDPPRFEPFLLDALRPALSKEVLQEFKRSLSVTTFSPLIEIPEGPLPEAASPAGAAQSEEPAARGAVAAAAASASALADARRRPSTASVQGESDGGWRCADDVLPAHMECADATDLVAGEQSELALNGASDYHGPSPGPQCGDGCRCCSRRIRLEADAEALEAKASALHALLDGTPPPDAEEGDAEKAFSEEIENAFRGSDSFTVDFGNDMDDVQGCCYEVSFGAMMLPTYGKYRSSSEQDCATEASLGGATVFEAHSCRKLKEKHAAAAERAEKARPELQRLRERNSSQRETDALTCARKVAQAEDPLGECIGCVGIRDPPAGYRGGCSCECARTMLRVLHSIDPECCQGQGRVQACLEFFNDTLVMQRRVDGCELRPGGVGGGFGAAASALGFGDVEDKALREHDEEQAYATGLAKALGFANVMAEVIEDIGEVIQNRTLIKREREREERLRHEALHEKPAWPADFQDVASALGLGSNISEAGDQEADADYAQSVKKALQLAHEVSQANSLAAATTTTGGDAGAAEARGSSAAASGGFESVAKGLGFAVNASHGNGSEESAANELVNALDLAHKLKTVQAAAAASPLSTTSETTTAPADEKTQVGGSGGLPPWWILNGVTPEGPAVDVGSYKEISFSPAQQEQFGVDRSGSVVDQRTFDAAIAALKASGPAATLGVLATSTDAPTRKPHGVDHFKDVAEALGFGGGEDDEDAYAKRVHGALKLAHKLKQAPIWGKPLLNLATPAPTTTAASTADSFGDVAKALGFTGEVASANGSSSAAEGAFAEGLTGSLELAHEIQKLGRLAVDAGRNATQQQLGSLQERAEPPSSTSSPSSGQGGFFKEVADGLGFGSNASKVSSGSGSFKDEEAYAKSLADALHLASGLAYASGLSAGAGNASTLTTTMVPATSPRAGAAPEPPMLLSSTAAPVMSVTTSVALSATTSAAPLLEISATVEPATSTPKFSLPLAPGDSVPASSPESGEEGEEGEDVPGAVLVPGSVAEKGVMLAGWLTFKASGVTAVQVRSATAAALSQVFQVEPAAVEVHLAAYRRLQGVRPLLLPQRFLKDTWSPTFIVSAPEARVAEVESIASAVNSDWSGFAGLLRGQLEAVGAPDDTLARSFKMTGFSHLTPVDALSSTTPRPGAIRGVYERMVKAAPGGQGQLHMLGAAGAALLCCLGAYVCLSCCRKPRAAARDGMGPDYQPVDAYDPPSSSEPPHFIVCVCFGRTFAFF